MSASVVQEAKMTHQGCHNHKPVPLSYPNDCINRNQDGTQQATATYIPPPPFPTLTTPPPSWSFQWLFQDHCSRCVCSR